jgi:hypothetical protein
VKRYLAKLMTVGTVSLALAVSAGFADQVDLLPKEARALAWESLSNHRPDITLEIADALVKRNPEDFEATLLKAEALRTLQQGKPATKAAMQAWALALTEEQWFDAAHLVAKSYFAQGAKSRAQFWLRRAEQNAPNDKARNLAVRDFQYVRRSKAFSSNFFFSVFPTSNINNGSENLKSPIALVTLGPASLPHSGTGISLGFQTNYRKPLSARALLRFSVKANGTMYRLSEATKALGSGKRGADFAYGTVEFQTGVTLIPKASDTPGWGASRFDVALGRSWYGGNALANSARLSFGQDYHFTQNTYGQVQLEYERQSRLDSAKSSSNTASLDLDMSHSLRGNARLGYGVSVRDTRSADHQVQNRAFSARVSYTANPWPMAVVPTFSISVERADYNFSTIFAVDRSDDRQRVAASFSFPKISYYGFAPTVNLSASRTNSTISIYSTKGLRMSLGIQSTF